MSDQPLRTLLLRLRALAISGGDSLYGNLDTAIKEIDSILEAENLRNETGRIKFLLLPTAGKDQRAILIKHKLEIQ